MRRGLESIVVFMAGCGLFEGGPPDDFVADAAPDLALEDRGTMITDSGQTCSCVLPDAEKDGWTYAGGQPASTTCPTDWTRRSESAGASCRAVSVNAWQSLGHFATSPTS